MDHMKSFTETVSEEFNFVDFDENNPGYDAVSDNVDPICVDLNKTMRGEEFHASSDDESDFEKASRKLNEGLVSVSSYKPVRKKSDDAPDIPDYLHLLEEKLQHLIICAEEVRKGKMPLTPELDRQLKTACIYISPNTSTASSTGLLEMSQATKDLLEEEEHNIAA